MKYNRIVDVQRNRYYLTPSSNLPPLTLSERKTDACFRHPAGSCVCKPNFSGARCDECAPGHYDYPNCLSCQCDKDGALGADCANNGKWRVFRGEWPVSGRR